MYYNGHNYGDRETAPRPSLIGRNDRASSFDAFVLKSTLGKDLPIFPPGTQKEVIEDAIKNDNSIELYAADDYRAGTVDLTLKQDLQGFVVAGKRNETPKAVRKILYAVLTKGATSKDQIVEEIITTVNSHLLSILNTCGFKEIQGNQSGQNDLLCRSKNVRGSFTDPRVCCIIDVLFDWTRADWKFFDCVISMLYLIGIGCRRPKNIVGLETHHWEGTQFQRFEGAVIWTADTLFGSVYARHMTPAFTRLLMHMTEEYVEIRFPEVRTGYKIGMNHEVELDWTVWQYNSVRFESHEYGSGGNTRRSESILINRKDFRVLKDLPLPDEIKSHFDDFFKLRLPTWGRAENRAFAIRTARRQLEMLRAGQPAPKKPRVEDTSKIIHMETDFLLASKYNSAVAARGETIKKASEKYGGDKYVPPLEATQGMTDAEVEQRRQEILRDCEEE